MTTAMMPLNSLLNNFFYPTTSCRSMRRSEAGLAPRTNILESDKEYIIRMDLPGVKRDDLNIEIEGETLQISATRELGVEDGYRTLRSEMAEKVAFERSFDLGRTIDGDGIKAAFENGVLSVSLPKTSAALARRIEVE